MLTLTTEGCDGWYDDEGTEVTVVGGAGADVKSVYVVSLQPHSHCFLRNTLIIVQCVWLILFIFYRWLVFY